MAVSAPPDRDSTLRQEILGSRRFSNYFWATIVSMGALGFFLSSLSSFFKVNFLIVSDPTQLIFVPQGLAMGFYGTAGLLLATYLWLAINWDVGGGYNLFNKNDGSVTLLRKGYPGKNRKVELSYEIDDVIGVRIEIKEGINPKRALYLRVKGRGDLPLTRVGQPISLSELEDQGAELARFLEVPLEGL
ncbi:MAG: photosystem I assembly protein Ycf4 [Cyanobacteria bacterium P01_D01_bin.73]